MHRTLGIPVRITGALLGLSLLACVFVGLDNDQGDPGGSTQAKVVAKCNTMDFDTTRASVLQPLDDDSLVIVRIIPAVLSSKTKLKQLVSKKGRIIAKVVNVGTGDWPAMALTAGSTSCWYVWGDNEERLRSKFVSLTPGGAEKMDPNFDVYFHSEDHSEDSSAWNPPYMSDMSETSGLFRLASRGDQPSLLKNSGWTTCLLNGCCRSRQ